MLSTSYHAKLLLWGEHIVIHGAQALATPLSLYSGRWKPSPEGDRRRLEPFLQYLQASGMDKILDLNAFSKHILNGLVFDSDIPGGYGLGSSGALCAAIYDNLARNKIMPGQQEHYHQLKTLLGKMESFFHGSSSGTDPLISYLNQTVLLNGSDIRTLNWQLPGAESSWRFFLLDTGIQRQAGIFIEYFLNKTRDSHFQQILNETLLPANEQAIKYTLDQAFEALLPVFHEVSAFQLNHLPGLLPPGFEELWKKGLSSDLFKLKICGAGGGGFILGFTRDFEQTSNVLKEFSLLVPN